MTSRVRIRHWLFFRFWLKVIVRLDYVGFQLLFGFWLGVWSEITPEYIHIHGRLNKLRLLIADQNNNFRVTHG